MDESERTALADAVLSGLLKWEFLRIQEYERFEGPIEEKEQLRANRRLETMFLLRRGLHVGFYQIVTRELKRDTRWDEQRAELVREGIETLVSSTGTFEPAHHAKESLSRRGTLTARQHQRRYHDYFPEFFFNPGTPVGARGRDKRFKLLSTVFSPLDVPGYVPAKSPFFVLDSRYVAAPRFMRTALTVPGTLDFTDDLLAFRTLVTRTMGAIKARGDVNEERFSTVHRWLTTYGPISVAFRAQVAAITSAYWFRRQDPARRRELIGIACPRDDTAMERREVVERYEALGLSERQVAPLLDLAKAATQEEDEWWERMDAAAESARAAFRDWPPSYGSDGL